MSLATLEAQANAEFLSVFGTLITTSDDVLGDGTLVLLGPKEPGFWPHATEAPEFADNQSDPLDRWSRRVITEIATRAGGTALFPFGDPPRPFIGWALRSGRAWSSPVGLLVHDAAGLMVSYRGAIFLENHIEPPSHATSPCDTCQEKPCLTACPVGALSANGYDLDTCHKYLDTPPGADCMTNGCAVRRACPISRTYARRAEQSAFHMAQFHRK